MVGPGTPMAEAGVTAVAVAPQLLLPKEQPPVPFVEWGRGTPLEGNVFNAQHVDVYGDLHGNTKVDLDKSPDRLKVFIGDIADRGPQSWQTVEKVIDQVQNGNALYCIGNHDALFMGAMAQDRAGGFRDRACLRTWLYNGGYITATGAGMRMEGVKNIIEPLASSEIMKQRSADLMNEYKGQGMSDAVAQQRADIQVRQDCLKMKMNHIEGIRPQQGDPLFTIKQAQFDAATQEMNNAFDSALVEARANSGLQRWNKCLQENGKVYVAVNAVGVDGDGGGFFTHAGILPDTDYGGYGQGLQGMDALQQKVKEGDSNAIHYLALGDDSPLWTREPYLNKIASPQEAHDLRAQLNAQAAVATADRPAFKVGVVGTGHTPIEYPEVKVSAAKTTSLNRPGDPKFVDIDYGADDEGAQVAVRMDVSDANEVSVKLVDTVTDQPVSAKDGSSVSAGWKLEGTAVIVGPEEAHLIVDPTRLSLLDPNRPGNVQWFEKHRAPGRHARNTWDQEKALIDKYPQARALFDTQQNTGQRFKASVVAALSLRGVQVPPDADLDNLTGEVMRAANAVIPDAFGDDDAKRMNVDVMAFVGDAVERVVAEGPVAKTQMEASQAVKPEAAPIRAADPEDPGTVEQQAADTASAAAGIISPELAGGFLEAIAKGNPLPVIEARVAELRNPDSTPSQLALAADLEIAGIQWRIMELNEAGQGRRLSPALNAERNDLIGRLDTLTKQRESGKVILDDGTERSIQGEPNQVIALAKTLGVPAEVAEKNPLYGAREHITEAIQDKGARKVFVDNLRARVADGTLPLTEEQLEHFITFLDKAARGEWLKGKAKLAAKVSAISALLMVLMMYLSSKGQAVPPGGH